MIGARAKEALRRTAQWEKRTLGLGALLPPALKRPFARAIRKNLLPEGRKFIAADKLEQLFAALHRNRRNLCGHPVVRKASAEPGRRY